MHKIEFTCPEYRLLIFGKVYIIKMAQFYQNYDKEVFMIEIRPVSDLRNKFTEIETTVKKGAPVYLTKNGYGSMVVMSIEAYSKLTESVEDALDVADRMAEETTERYTHEEIFAKMREAVND
jgi:prevent-host-death family protein